MKRFIGILLSLTMLISGVSVINAEESSEAVESVLLSVNKTVECGIIGSGTEHSDMAGHGSVNVMVDGIKGSDNSGSAANKLKMWYYHSTKDGDKVYLNLDLEDAYMITSIGWRTRYPSTAKADYQGMKIYGANEADYSDMVLIHTVGTDITVQNAEFTIADENKGEYRYLRFEKETYIGGQELYVYGYKNQASNANLSSLSVEGCSFDTEFNANDTEYSAIVYGAADTVTVNAVAENEAAVIAGAGEVALNEVGTTVIPVTVTSENGTVKTYTISISVVATELLSKNKPVAAGIDGTGSQHSDTSGFGSEAIMVDGKTTNATKSAMWYAHSTVNADMIYLNVDLEDAYMITKIGWRGRYDAATYAKSANYDYHSMKIYGANNADYSDKALIYEVGTDSNERDIEFVIAPEKIAEYRYIRCEKKNTMGGQEIYVYGYDASDADLSAMSVDGYVFDSEFSADDTEYTVILNGLPENNVVKINATPELATSTVRGAGEITVDTFGTIAVPVTVTTVNGTEKTYTIKFVVLQSELVSLNKPVEFGIIGTGTMASDTTGHGEVSVMVDGVKGSDNNGSASNKLKMWYAHSTVSSDTVYINLDLQDTYKITSIGWRTRYPNVAKYDYQNMTVYGANNADYSDKVEILKTGTDVSEQNAVFDISADKIANYRYIRFEKKETMGGLELYVYGAPTIMQTVDGAVTTVTIPGDEYSVGDMIITAIYNADKTLKNVAVVPAENTVSTEIKVEKDESETAKIMIWNNFTDMDPVIPAINVK